MRSLRAMLASAASVVLVTAVSGTAAGGTDDEPVTTEAEAEPYSFSYPSWMWEEGDVGLWHHDRRAEFEEVFDHIEVDTTNYASSDFEQQILIQMSAGDSPDLLPVFTNMLPPLIEEGLLAPLDECLAGTGIEERLLPSVSVAQRDGTTYGVPLTMSPRGLLYNTELMERAGVTDVPETPEQLLEASRQVMAETGEFGYAFSSDPSEVLQTYIESMNWILGNGSDWSQEDGTITANDPANVEALETMMTFYDEGLTPVGLPVNDVRALFTEGKAAFLIEGPWVMTRVQSENPDLYPSIGFAPPPTATNAAVTGGAFWVIPEGSEHYDDACEFLKINLAEDAQRAWLEDLVQIPGMVVEPSEEFLDENPWVSVMIEVADLYPGGLGYAPSGHRVEAEAFRQTAVDSLAQIFAGNLTVAEALDEAQNNLEAQFGE